MFNRSSTKGFTLIEVLISLVIMSSVIALSVGAFRMFQPANVADSEKVIDKSNKLIQFKKISRSIRSILHYNFNDKNGDNRLAFYGDDEYLMFVTSHPVSGDFKIALAVLYRAVSPINGLVSLNYCEHPLGAINLNYIETENVRCQGRTTIRYLTDTRQIELDYFGWENRGVYFQAESNWFSDSVKGKPSWWSNFSAIDRELLPFFIRIKVRSNEAQDRVSEMFFRLNDEDPRLASFSTSSSLDG